jgi:hypothetical protein
MGLSLPPFRPRSRLPPPMLHVIFPLLTYSLLPARGLVSHVALRATTGSPRAAVSYCLEDSETAAGLSPSSPFAAFMAETASESKVQEEETPAEETPPAADGKTDQVAKSEEEARLAAEAKAAEESKAEEESRRAAEEKAKAKEEARWAAEAKAEKEAKAKEKEEEAAKAKEDEEAMQAAVAVAKADELARLAAETVAREKADEEAQLAAEAETKAEEGARAVAAAEAEEAAKLREECSATRARLDELSSAAAAAQEEAASASAELAELRARCAELEREEAKSAAEAARVGEEVREARERAAALEATVSEERASLAAAVAEAEAEAAAVKEQTEASEKLPASIEAAKEAAARFASSRAKLEEKVAPLRKEAKSRDAELRRERSSFGSMRSAYQKERAAARSAGREKDRLVAEAETTTKAVAEVQAQQAATRVELDELRERLPALVADREAAEAALSETLQAVASLREESGLAALEELDRYREEESAVTRGGARASHASPGRARRAQSRPAVQEVVKFGRGREVDELVEREERMLAVYSREVKGQLEAFSAFRERMSDAVRGASEHRQRTTEVLRALEGEQAAQMSALQSSIEEAGRVTEELRKEQVALRERNAAEAERLMEGAREVEAAQAAESRALEQLHSNLEQEARRLASERARRKGLALEEKQLKKRLGALEGQRRVASRKVEYGEIDAAQVLEVAGVGLITGISLIMKPIMSSLAGSLDKGNKNEHKQQADQK